MNDVEILEAVSVIARKRLPHFAAFRHLGTHDLAMHAFLAAREARFDPAKGKERSFRMLVASRKLTDLWRLCSKVRKAEAALAMRGEIEKPYPAKRRKYERWGI